MTLPGQAPVALRFLILDVLFRIVELPDSGEERGWAGGERRDRCEIRPLECGGRTPLRHPP